MLAVAAFVAAGCVNEEPPYKEEPKPTPGDATGFLSVSGLSMRVVYDETDVRPDDTSDQTQSPQAVSGTRAEQPDVDGFIVEILDADNAQVFKKTYAELKQQLAEPMELPVGAYRMEVRSEESTPDVAWEHPVYGATSSFTISKAQTTQLEEVVCTLQNIKVTVDYSSELAGMLADTSKATISLGQTSQEFLKTETRAAYFKSLDIENTLDFNFDGVFADTDIPAQFSGEKKYRIMAFAELKKFTVSVGDDSYDLLTGTHEGISFSPTDKYNTELTLSDAFFGGLPGGDHAVTIHVEDANGGSNEISTTYRLQGLVPVTEKSYDLWANTVTLQVVDFTRSANVTFGLCGSDGQWKYQTGTSQGDDFISATFAPQWQESTNANGHTVYTRETGTGVVATHGYDYKVTIDGTEKSGSFTAGAAQTIPNADMSGWSMTSGFAFPNAEGGSFWSSGNNTMTKTLCTSTDVKFGKAAPAAKLTSTNMLVLAAGNLFTGTFAYKSFTGTVQFGQPYDFTVRPSALKVKYHAKVGTVDKVRTSGDICPYIKKGDPDMARIFVAIVDWNAPHQVVSAMTTTKGAWDPEKGIDNVSEGKILGYGSLWITQSTEGDDMQDAELEIVWYDHETRPSGGGYSLVISCACNAYGDYFTGCSTNVMYVDDFEWVY